MRILGIETSCDETAAAIVDDGISVVCSVIASTKEVFRDAGGVVPEDAARRQVECILPVLHAALAEGNTDWSDIDAIAVTRGPGLLGSLLVGTTAARALAALHKKPLIGVHHTFGHLTSSFLDQENTPEFPMITLSASGGHTDLWYRKSHTEGTLLGSTRDDAAGEAFDKGAAMLDLPYPGGPSISKAAEGGDERSYGFPLPLRGEEGYDFSFSGLKTSLKYTIRDCAVDDDIRANLAASFQYAICTHLIGTIKRAVDAHSDVKEIHIVGGVSANTRLRELLKETFPTHTARHPKTLKYCTDNAAMIAGAAFFWQSTKQFTTVANLSLAEWSNL